MVLLTRVRKNGKKATAGLDWVLARASRQSTIGLAMPKIVVAPLYIAGKNLQRVTARHTVGEDQVS